jgi:hypothetical protein
VAAGAVTLPFKDANGVTRQAQFWSSDGTTSGNLASLMIIQDSLGNPVIPDVSSFFASALIAKTLIVAGVPNLMDFQIYNPNASVAYVQVFNAATTGAVTLGSTVPMRVIPILASSLLVQSELNWIASAGLVVAATTTATGSTAVGTGLVASFGYR